MRASRGQVQRLELREGLEPLDALNAVGVKVQLPQRGQVRDVLDLPDAVRVQEQSYQADVPGERS